MAMSLLQTILKIIGAGVVTILWTAVWEFVIKPILLPSRFYYRILRISNSIRLRRKNIGRITTTKSFEFTENFSVDHIYNLLKKELPNVFNTQLKFFETIAPYIIEAQLLSSDLQIRIDIEEKGNNENEYPGILVSLTSQNIKFENIGDVIRDHIFYLDELYIHLNDKLQNKVTRNDRKVEIVLELSGKTLFDYFFKTVEEDTIKIGSKLVLQKNKDTNVIKIYELATPQLAEKIKELTLIGVWSLSPNHD